MNLSNKEKDVLIELLNMAVDIENNSDMPSKQYLKTTRNLIKKLEGNKEDFNIIWALKILFIQYRFMMICI